MLSKPLSFACRLMDGEDSHLASCSYLDDSLKRLVAPPHVLLGGWDYLRVMAHTIVIKISAFEILLAASTIACPMSISFPRSEAGGVSLRVIVEFPSCILDNNHCDHIFLYAERSRYTRYKPMSCI